MHVYFQTPSEKAWGEWWWHVSMQVHPRGNAVFLRDRLLHPQAWDQQHLICHLYVYPSFLHPARHHFLLLQPPALHRASGKSTLARCWINHQGDCTSREIPSFLFPLGMLAVIQSRVSGDVTDLMAQGRFRRAGHCQHGSLYPGPPAGGSLSAQCHPDALINNAIKPLIIP